jgi:hypothetical protein
VAGLQGGGGGSITLHSSKAILSDCVLRDNSVTSPDSTAEGPLQLLVEDHDFLANLATCGVDEDGCGASGGGVWIEHAVALGGTSTVRGNPLAFNSAPTCGWST